MIRNLNATSSMDRRIAELRMRESDRRIAREHMRDADRVADIVYRAVERLRSAEGLLARLLVQRARRTS